MAEAANKVTVAFSTTITLNEVEICALEALVGYGADAFLKVFKANLGTSYIRNHEDGIRSLFQAISRDVLPAHRMVHEARIDLVNGRQKRTEDRRASAEKLRLRVEKLNAKEGDA